MHSALSQKLNRLQFMGQVYPSFETAPSQRSSAVIIVPEKVKNIDTKMSFQQLHQESATVESRSQHQTVPVTTRNGEVELVSPTQAQASRAKASVKRDYKHCKANPKAHTISGNGTARKQGKCTSGKKSKSKSAQSKKKGTSKSKNKKAGKGKKKKSTQSKKKAKGKKSNKSKAKKS